MEDAALDYAAFVRQHARSLFGTAYLLCGDAAGAEDLVQDTLAACFERWARVSKADSPVGYVRRALVNRFVDTRRGPRGRVTPVDEIPDTPTDDDIADALVTRELVHDLLAMLPERPRAALILKYLYDWPDDQIADALRCRPATVRSLTRRSLRRLRGLALTDAETQHD